MTKVAAGITTPLDGYITGPNDEPGRGLGDGGERLHFWVFGGPWRYAEEPRGETTGADKELLDEAVARVGANPFGVPFFIVTHRPEEAPADGAFTFVNGLDQAIARAREAADGKDVFIMGGATYPTGAACRARGGAIHLDCAGRARRRETSVRPFDETMNLEHVRLLQSPFATHITYRVVR